MLGLARDALHMLPSPKQHLRQGDPRHLASLTHHDHDGQPTQSTTTDAKHQHCRMERQRPRRESSTALGRYGWD